MIERIQYVPKKRAEIFFDDGRRVELLAPPYLRRLAKVTEGETIHVYILYADAAAQFFARYRTGQGERLKILELDPEQDQAHRHWMEKLNADHNG